MTKPEDSPKILTLCILTPEETNARASMSSKLRELAQMLDDGIPLDEIIETYEPNIPPIENSVCILSPHTEIDHSIFLNDGPEAAQNLSEESAIPLDAEEEYSMNQEDFTSVLDRLESRVENGSLILSLPKKPDTTIESDSQDTP